ncbi:hypothetical protein RRK80_004706 [Salmonella enterica]|nr:hypothetical protein [Salmonella enterica]
MKFNLAAFNGKPCRKCGSTLRHGITKRCIACKKALDDAAYQRKKVLQRHDETE